MPLKTSRTFWQRIVRATQDWPTSTVTVMVRPENLHSIYGKHVTMFDATAIVKTEKITFTIVVNEFIPKHHVMLRRGTEQILLPFHGTIFRHIPEAE